MPNEAQVPAAQAHWLSKGVETVAAVVAPYRDSGFEEAGRLFRKCGVPLVAIDCMGFAESHRERLKALCGCPVLLPKTLVARVALEMHNSTSRPEL